MVKPIIDRRLRILLGLLAIAASVLPALACGGRGGGDVRPDKQKTIVSNTPDGYEPAVARQLAHWSGRWQILQYAFMSRAGNTTTIDSAEMDYFAFLAEHTGGSDPAMRPSNAGYLLIPYRYGTPSYDTADNGDFHDFGDETWTFADSSSGLDALTSANLVLAEVELARIYHTPSVFGDPETHDFGATQRLHGLLLVEIAKRQAMHFINNRNSYEVTPEGQLRMIAALGALIRVLRQPTFNGTDNRYRDVNFSGQLLAWMDFFFDEYTDSPAPATANGLCDAIVNLGYYVTNTLDSSLRTQATSLIENYADALADYQTTDPVEQASRIRGLAEAGRLTFDQTRYSRITEAFQSLKNDYRPQTGVFEGRQNLTAYEVGRIVGALNAATELAAAFIDTDWAQLIMSDFIAASLYLGGMYRSTYPPSVLSDYEQPQNPLYYTFPGLPFNRDTGGFGTAPSFASRIAQKENAEGWEVENASFDAVGALSLSIELLSLQPSKFYPWPQYSGGVSSPLRFGKSEYTFPVALNNAYYTGRIALLEFALKSAVGNTFSLSPNVISDIVGQTSSPATSDSISYPLNPSLLRIPYEYASPSFLVPYNGNRDDYSNFRWTTAGTDLSENALAYLLLAETRLARHFHNDDSFGQQNVTDYGAAERLKGLMLFNAIKQQIEDLDDGTYSLPRTFEGRCAMLLALSEVAKLVSTSAQPGSTTNRYYDISLFATVGGLMENDYQFLVSNPLPTELEKIRLFSRCMFEYALAITDNQRAALARGYVMQAADNALNATLADSVDKASLLVILYDALRFGATGEYRSEFRKAFILLADEYDPYYGTFASRSRYSLKQSAVVLEGLLAANRFDQQLIDAELSQNLIRGFIEGTYMLSGLVRSAWAPWEFPAHELGLADINYRYPSLPYPLYAGGDNGIAPVFARQIEFISFGGYWNVLDTLSHTPSLMYASDVLMRCNFEAFPEPDIPQYLQ